MNDLGNMQATRRFLILWMDETVQNVCHESFHQCCHSSVLLLQQSPLTYLVEYLSKIALSFLR